MNNMKKSLAGLAFSAVLAVSAVHAASIASVSLVGNNFLQSGRVENSAGNNANIAAVVYSLGPAGDGIATWEVFNAGGIASDFLGSTNWYQTQTWGGLSIAPGAAFDFSGLDIDLIVTLNPLNVTGNILDNTGSSLVGAFVTVTWSDGSFGTQPLAQTPWDVNQSFRIVSNGAAVPEPGVLGLLALGALVLGVAARRRRAA